MIALTQILVATDFSEPSHTALAYGRELAARFEATLHLLHVVEDAAAGALGDQAFIPSGTQLQLEADARRRLERAVAEAPSRQPTIPVLRTSTVPAFAIVEYARAHKIDAIVMGTHGAGAFAHLVLGRVAERVVRFAPCPVLTVKHPEREFVHPDAAAAMAHA